MLSKSSTLGTPSQRDSMTWVAGEGRAAPPAPTMVLAAARLMRFRGMMVRAYRALPLLLMVAICGGGGALESNVELRTDHTRRFY